MKTLYQLTLKTDAGKVTFRTHATTFKQAARQILDAERAPESAVVAARMVNQRKETK